MMSRITVRRKWKSIVVLITALYYFVVKKGPNRRPKRFWVRSTFKNRTTQGDYHNLLNEMRLTDTEKYFNYLRMSAENFNKLLAIVGPKLTKMYCVREPISCNERFALTLRYLASGDSMVSMSYSFRVGKTRASNIIHETCNVLWDSLQRIVFPTPSQEMWKCIAADFDKRWQLPNCVGAIDGKHVNIEAPPHSGSRFYNYKQHHSIVLLALCDANYKFTIIDVEGEGRHSDGGIFSNSAMGKSLASDENLNFPKPSKIDLEGDVINYYIAADGAFPLTTNIMRPYPGHFLSQNKRLFNYRGRRVIENSFGILTARWRIYKKPISTKLSTTEGIMRATVCLHNWIMIQESEISNAKRIYCTNNFVDYENDDGIIVPGRWRQTDEQPLQSVNRVGSNMYGVEAEKMRNKLTAYFLFEGAIPFQWNK